VNASANSDLMGDRVYELVHQGDDVYRGIDPDGFEKIMYGWNSDSEAFLEVIEETRPKYILEIGSWLGASAIHMAKFVKEVGLDTKIVCVDTWLGSREFMGKGFPGDRSKLFSNGLPAAYGHFLANVKREGVHDTVIPVPQTSSNALRFFSEQGVMFDAVYIDGSNQYEDIRSDMHLSWNVLKEGGVMFGDDYTNFSYPQINSAVNSFVYSNRLKEYFRVRGDGSFWSLKKKDRGFGL